MKFIELSGKTLQKIVTVEEKAALEAAGVTENCLLRVNPQGDLELRKREDWAIIGGLLGDFEQRVKSVTHLDWA
jgi:hypothetical protein